jgi:hypothetical protein
MTAWGGLDETTYNPVVGEVGRTRTHMGTTKNKAREMMERIALESWKG